MPPHPLPARPPAALLARAGVVLRFGVSGLLAAASLFATLYLLTDLLRLWYVASAGIAWIISMAVSFALQRNWTFRSRGREGARAQLVAFIALGLFNAAANAGLMYLLVDRAGLNYLAAQLLLAVLIAVWNFAIMRFAIFPHRPEAG